MSPKRNDRPVDVYVRVGRVRGREGDSFQSPAQQEQRCRAQLAADGLEVGGVFEDLDWSGGKTSRPAFDKVLDRARTGESGGVIVHDRTRFGRYSTMAQDIIDLDRAILPPRHGGPRGHVPRADRGAVQRCAAQRS